MIPKTIHYCWFGRNPKPKQFKKCLKSWHKYCGDYKVIEWNEDNFDIYSNLYVKQAYESKKWAFVTDYVRLYVLYHYGGIYMDTDVEVIKPLDCFLKDKAFSGFEDQHNIPTGIMGSEKGHPAIKKLLDYYDDRSFLINGKPDLTTNVVTITNIMKKYGLIQNNQYQVVFDMALYPNDYFCPQDFATGFLTVTENTYTIHHFAGSWLPDNARKTKQYNRRYARIKKACGERAATVYETYYYSKKRNGFKGIAQLTVKIIVKRINSLFRNKQKMQ